MKKHQTLQNGPVDQNHLNCVDNFPDGGTKVTLWISEKLHGGEEEHFTFLSNRAARMEPGCCIAACNYIFFYSFL